jgi:hypothetical protein
MRRRKNVHPQAKERTNAGRRTTIAPADAPRSIDTPGDGFNLALP